MFAFFILLAAVIVVIGTSIPIFAGAGTDGFIPLGIGFAVALVLSLVALPFFLAALGLWKNKSWGAAMAIVAAVINAFNIPLGTALTVYTFWAVVKGKLDGPPVER